MDTPLLYAINHFARVTTWAHPLVTAYASYGVILFALIVLGGWWIARRGGDPSRMAAALSAGIATVLAIVANQPLSSFFARPRPFVAHRDLLLLADHGIDWSFPSDHATMAGAVAVGVLIVSRQLGVIAAVAALAMAFSRVYIGVHYPGDVAAGLMLGAIVAVLTYVILRRPLTVLATAMARTRLRTLVAASVTE